MSIPPFNFRSLYYKMTVYNAKESTFRTLLRTRVALASANYQRGGGT